MLCSLVEPCAHAAHVLGLEGFLVLYFMCCRHYLQVSVTPTNAHHGLFTGGVLKAIVPHPLALMSVMSKPCLMLKLRRSVSIPEFLSSCYTNHIY